MSINSAASASILNAGQSPLLSLNAAKHRKHPSATDVDMQNAGPANVPAGGNQPGSKVNVTA